MLKEGDRAPYFELKDQDGKIHKLTDYDRIVLYFYPKDDTSGCTTEACGFRDDISEYGKRKIMIFGVSNDPVDSHKKFAAKYNLNFPLLADLDKKVSIDYGVYGEKKFLGRTYVGIRRTTFLIEKGKVKKVFEKVDVKTHSKEILEVFK
jgi:thioredoxin-dependent peroxiredoxin